MGNYVVYHAHSMLSNGTTNVDSITDFHAYVDRAKDLGMKAMAFSEHGNIFGWKKKKDYIEECGMKYIHAVEAYITEDCGEADENGKYIKNRDNYHTVLIAKNYDGVREINKLVSDSHNRKDYHFYYMPRITLKELLNTSDNVIVTSACLAGILNGGTPTAKEKFLSFAQANKDRCFLEIQHHNCDPQIKYNKLLYNVSKETGIRLIAGTDTHALNAEHLDGRSMLQLGKGVYFEGEDDWDLSFKSYDELVVAYRKQNALPMDVVLDAINNTNVMADMIEEFVLDCNTKYPKIYDNPLQTYKDKINEAYKKHPYIRKRYKPKEIHSMIKEEVDVYEKTKSIDFMLLQTYVREWERANGIYCGYGRGSVSGSEVAYILGITQMDSKKFGLNFFRFMNPSRVTNADIDTDYSSEDRDKVKEFILKDHMGLPNINASEIVTFNTIAKKGAIRDICRAFHVDNLRHLPKDVREEIEAFEKKSKEKSSLPKSLEEKYKKYSIHKEVPYKYISLSDEVSNLLEFNEDSLRKKYKDIFKYVDLVNGVVVSVGSHPSGILVSDLDIESEIGMCSLSSSEYPVSMLNMKELDNLMYVKLSKIGWRNGNVA